MRRRFPKAIVAGYEQLIPTLDFIDADDRHVLAAAVHCRAQFIVTENLKHFPTEILVHHGIEAITADDFLCRTHNHSPASAYSVLVRMQTGYTSPPLPPPLFVQDLINKKLPRLAEIYRKKQMELWRDAARGSSGRLP